LKQFYTIYKTTNIINGKFYYGKHVTASLDDGYLGSGNLLKLAIKKYGRKNFIKEILFVFDNKTDMNNKEKEIINETILNDKNCYNIAIGGQGGNLGEDVNIKIGQIMSKINKGKIKSQEHKIKLSISNKGKKRTTNIIEKIKQCSIERMSKLTPEEKKEKFGHKKIHNGFYGKQHNPETIEKIKKTIGNTRKGGLNPNAKPVLINGILFNTKKDAKTSLGLTTRELNKILENTSC